MASFKAAIDTDDTDAALRQSDFPLSAYVPHSGELPATSNKCAKDMKLKLSYVLRGNAIFLRLINT